MNNKGDKSYNDGPSKEVFEISAMPIPKWRIFLFQLVSKLLNVREEFPYRWRYKGKKIVL
jgi:hypothetical protein